MTTPDAPLLVVAHEGYRNGATRVLVDLLTAVAGDLPCPLRVRTRRDGPLARELHGLDTDRDPVARPRAVLVNSTVALDALDDVADDVPVAVYAHETGEALTTRTGHERDLLISRADLVLHVSEAAGAALVGCGVPPHRLRLLPPVIAPRDPGGSPSDDARAILGGTDDTRLVVGCGEATWRKGTDLFVALAGRLASRDDLRFAWIGRRHRSYARVLDVDTRLAGVEGTLTWVGEVADPAPLLAAADLLVLPSREDPQPLVPLEGAAAGTATVGFTGTGLDDLAAIGAATTVPYPDVAALAAAVESLLADPDRRRSHVDAGRRLVADARAPTVVGPRFLAVIDELLATERHPDPSPTRARP